VYVRKLQVKAGSSAAAPNKMKVAARARPHINRVSIILRCPGFGGFFNVALDVTSFLELRKGLFGPRQARQFRNSE
jgi:hypothetical protein